MKPITHTTLKSQWHIEPMPSNYKTIETNHLFYTNEMSNIQAGYLPTVMEEKWFIYFENNMLFLHRSWTGFLVYRCLFRDESNGAILHTIECNSNTKQYCPQSDKLEIEMVLFLISTFLLGRHHPSPYDNEPLSYISAVGLSCHSPKEHFLTSITDPQTNVTQTFNKVTGELISYNHEDWGARLATFHIAGFSFYDGQRLIETGDLAKGDILVLRLEPDNSHDSQAVALYSGRHKLGFIPKDKNSQIYTLLQMNYGVFLTAQIELIDTRAQAYQKVKVTIFLYELSKD